MMGIRNLFSRALNIVNNEFEKFNQLNFVGDQSQNFNSQYSKLIEKNNLKLTITLKSNTRIRWEFSICLETKVMFLMDTRGGAISNT
jgi:hypothetical protein